MNLSSLPTRDQLRQLLAVADDRAGPHVLWVNEEGTVHLTRLPAGGAAVFESAHPDVRVRLETFERGNEYVGPAAAADEGWVAELFDRLLSEWERAQQDGQLRYVQLDG